MITTQVFKERRFTGYFLNSNVLLVVVLIFPTWYHSSLGFGEIKIRLHFKRKHEDRNIHIKGKASLAKWMKRLNHEHSTGLGKAAFVHYPSVSLWEQSPSHPYSPNESWPCQPTSRTPPQNTHFWRANKVHAISGIIFFQVILWFPFKDQLFLNRIFQSSHEAPNEVEEA